MPCQGKVVSKSLTAFRANISRYLFLLDNLFYFLNLFAPDVRPFQHVIKLTLGVDNGKAFIKGFLTLRDKPMLCQQASVICVNKTCLAPWTPQIAVLNPLGKVKERPVSGICLWWHFKHLPGVWATYDELIA
jgi:hypothetical protein